MDKILLIDKPKNWTSFDVIAKIRNAVKKVENTSSKKIRVGHAGTLDPFATGLLIVFIGKATKKQDEFMKKDKEYTASIYLGATSSTGDPDGIIEEILNSNFKIPNKLQIEEILNSFKGSIDQTPHAFSAIKVDGKRAYELAREGKKVNLKSRKVYIYEIELLDYKYPTLKIRVRCSSGTYIRVLAEDIGKALGSGAYLTELRRTKIDKFDVSEALSIELALEQINLEKN